jgi:hypothetical protein
VDAWMGAHLPPSLRTCRWRKASLRLGYGVALQARGFGSVLRAEKPKGYPDASNTPVLHCARDRLRLHGEIAGYRDDKKISKGIARNQDVLLVLRPGSSRPPARSSSVSSLARARNHFINCREASTRSINLHERMPDTSLARGHHGPRLTERTASAAAGALCRCLQLHLPEVSLLYQLVVTQAARGAV